MVATHANVSVHAPIACTACILGVVRVDFALGVLGVTDSLLCGLATISKPEHDLRSAQWSALRQLAAAARITLIGELQQEIALDRIAAADLDARDRRIPWRGAGRGAAARAARDR